MASKKSTAKSTKKHAAVTRTAAPKNGWRDVEISDNAKIKVLAPANPYRGARAARWLYETGMTVGEAIAKGARRPDIRWDLAKGHIELSGKGGPSKPTSEAAVPPKPASSEAKLAGKTTPVSKRRAA